MTDSNEHVPANGDNLSRLVIERLPETIADLSALVRIPSVSWSAFDPAHVQRSAEAVADLARSTSVFDSVEIVRAPLPGSRELGQPAVLARREAKNGKPTVLLYAHHDVQPPGRDDDWDTAPFEPVVRGDRLFGRGAADDKAGVMAHIAALRSFVAHYGNDFDLGVALFIEGEEEFGSRSFASFLDQYRDALAADAIVVADSDNWDIDTPALTVSLRGNVTFRLGVRTLDHASHSGMFGGAVPDAMMASIRLLNSLWHEDGSVAVAGLTEHDAGTPEFDDAQLRTDAALRPSVAPIGEGSILSRLWNKPAITVTGMDVPDVGSASNTLLPQVYSRVSARIAPGQKADEAFAALKAHLAENVPFGAEITIDEVDTGSPFLVDTRGPIVAATLESMREGWGTEPVSTGIGGSIPFVADLVTAFPGAEILITGVEDPDTRAHSPNESLHLGVFRRAIVTEAILLSKLNESHA
ncbi:dipeptidase [Paramicrobacterium chengjingii]|uniref:Dipeptidase n=1 Tax=Paramicrobacterium chengjingii TaxID=2769067 RepID=A0ABX6YM32_9MICO|nr:dipeptidase [Microbacterium chengjingii]QPZ39883.1 dipeptidase [Microbacterium chengjingii]